MASKKQVTGGSLVEIIAEGGLPAFHCPLTGIPVWDEGGFEETAEQSPYLVFFVDWIGQVWATPPADEEDGWHGYMGKIAKIWSDPGGGNQNARIQSCVDLLPRSGVIFEILDPPYGPREGTICYACFDLQPLHPVQLEDLERRPLVQLECH